MKEPAIYIISNSKNGILYIGVTSNLTKRILEHKNKKYKGFSSRHNLVSLVYYEFGYSMIEAIKREKQLKKWKRNWKIRLIEELNPDWNDLFPEIQKNSCLRRSDAL